MKIGIIGFGYWGKIIYKNLNGLYDNIYICDINKPKNEDFNLDYFTHNYKDLQVDKVFVSTPCESHYEICKFFLSKSIDVFCEKPLSKSTIECDDLYEIAEKNKCKLYTDWLFLNNSAVGFIKKIINSNELGYLQSISMRRLNRGPYRNDVNARYDLMSHDLSILSYIFDSEPTKTNFYDFSRKLKSSFHDSCIAMIYYGSILCTLESSWEYPVKDRKCVFEFENGFILWDDDKQSIVLNDEMIDFSSQTPPLLNSINNFLKNDFNINFQKKITLNVTKLLEIK
jgi:UDP-N-acetylglucosamine 3-dehydrogenase